MSSPIIDPEQYFHDQTAHLTTPESKTLNFQRLFRRHNHALNEQPFFGILDDDLETLMWSGGGQVLAPLLGLYTPRPELITSFSGLFKQLGIDDQLRLQIQEQMGKLSDGIAMSFINRLEAKANNTFSIVFAHRENEPHGSIQFTLNDLSPFIKAEKSVRFMASTILEQMKKPSVGGRSDFERLHRIQTFVGKLLLLRVDKDIEELASTLYMKVETLAVRTTEILQGFNAADPAPAINPGAPVDTLDLSTVLPSHAQSFGDWEMLLRRIDLIADGQEHLSQQEARQLYFADSFIRHALPVMIRISPEGIIYVLNGPKRGAVYDDVDILVRDLGVEEDSRRSAGEFFSSKISGSTTLTINNENAEVRALVTSGGGTQFMILPAMTESIDVRGHFHAFKNLLLNLQVLYVVKTVKDVKLVGPALLDTLESIKDRMANLKYLARYGKTGLRPASEKVQLWIKAARLAKGNHPGKINITGRQATHEIAFWVPHGEMEDCLSEIVQNAYAHGARDITIDLSLDNERLSISISDDGSGISEQKLLQIREVIDTRRYDPKLSSRSNGSGHGILSAANVMSHFKGGKLEIGPNPSGQGTQVRLGMDLPG